MACAVLAAAGVVTGLVRGKDSTEPMEAPLKGLDDERFALWRVAIGDTIDVPGIAANR